MLREAVLLGESLLLRRQNDLFVDIYFLTLRSKRYLRTLKVIGIRLKSFMSFAGREDTLAFD